MDDAGDLLWEALPYLYHTRAKWVPDEPDNYKTRDKKGHWVGKTCASIDGMDQSGDWRCNCGSDDLRRRIRKFLNLA